jgi:hypothetical protein
MSFRALRAGTRGVRGCCSSLLLLALASMASVAQAQSIAERVNAVRDGRVILSYETRPGVCGFRDQDDSFNIDGDYVTCSGFNGHVNRNCIRGPAYVTLMREGGRTSSVHMRIGVSPARDGDVSIEDAEPDDVVEYMLGVARTLSGHGGERALAAAAVANSATSGPKFLAIAENQREELELRKQALFWAGQSTIPFADLASAWSKMDEEDLRTHFTFVVSQRKEPEATDELIHLVSERDHDVRHQAIFWLGQSKDPKARQYLLNLLMQ